MAAGRTVCCTTSSRRVDPGGVACFSSHPSRSPPRRINTWRVEERQNCKGREFATFSLSLPFAIGRCLPPFTAPLIVSFFVPLIFDHWEFGSHSRGNRHRNYMCNDHWRIIYSIALERENELKNGADDRRKLLLGCA
jgi:hypothetical protein